MGLRGSKPLLEILGESQCAPSNIIHARNLNRTEFGESFLSQWMVVGILQSEDALGGRPQQASMNQWV